MMGQGCTNKNINNNNYVSSSLDEQVVIEPEIP